MKNASRHLNWGVLQVDPEDGWDAGGVLLAGCSWMHVQLAGLEPVGKVGLMRSAKPLEAPGLATAFSLRPKAGRPSAPGPGARWISALRVVQWEHQKEGTIPLQNVSAHRRCFPVWKMSVILKRLYISIILEGLSVIKMEGRGRERGGGIEMIERHDLFCHVIWCLPLSPPARLRELFRAGEECAPNLDPGQKKKIN